MPKQAKRRFVGLSTEEVSLVDAPANEVEFLIVKNQEDPSMGATAEKKEAVRVPLEVEGEDSVTKALEHVNGIVDKIAGLVSTKKETKAPSDGGGDEPKPEEGGGDESETEEGDTEVETQVEKTSLKALLTKAGMDATQMKTAMAKLKAAGFDPEQGFPNAKKPLKPEKKVAKADEDEVAEPLTMASLASAVQKAAAFTPQRIKALQSAQEILKLVLEAVTPGTSPDSTVAPVSSHGNQSAVTELTNPKKKPTVTGTLKAGDGDDAVVSTLKALAGAVDKLVDRVEAIEKARPASNSLGGDVTDTATKKSSMWSGVL